MKAVGSGEFRYELVSSWPNLPRDWVFSDVPAAAVNSRGEVHVFSRGTHPATVWGPDGGFISSWGYGEFPFPHGIFVAPNDNVWLVDVLLHTATMHSPGGELLKTLGVKGRPAEGDVGRPFNMPTAVAIAPDGEIFASDRYGGHRVHRFSPDGELTKSWGKEGDGPGAFVNLHSVGVDSRGRVYICDHENDRIQIFDREGSFLEQWTDVTRPSDVCMVGDLVYVLDRPGEVSPVTVRSWTGMSWRV